MSKKHPSKSSRRLLKSIVAKTICTAFVLAIPTSIANGQTDSTKDPAPTSPAKPGPRDYRLKLTLENIKTLQSVHPAFAESTGEDGKQVREVVFLAQDGKLQRVTGAARPLPKSKQDAEAPKVQKRPLPNLAEDSTADAETLDLSGSSRKPGVETKVRLTDKPDSAPTLEEIEIALEASNFRNHAQESMGSLVPTPPSKNSKVLDSEGEEDALTAVAESTGLPGPSTVIVPYPDADMKALTEVADAKSKAPELQGDEEAKAAEPPKKTATSEILPEQKKELDELFGVPGLEATPELEVATDKVAAKETKEDQSDAGATESKEDSPTTEVVSTPSSESADETIEEMKPRGDRKPRIPARLTSSPTEREELALRDPVECPGAPDGSEGKADLQPGDLPLDQDDHPYDAPKARSISDIERSEPTVEVYSQRELQIRDGINRTLAYFLNNPETVVRRGPWALMHATLPFGVETDVVAGNRRVNAIGWMCYNGVCARQRMFQPTRTGFRTNVGPGVQGHEGQFLAILAQSRVNPDYPIKIGKRTHDINDLVRYEMVTCREKSELTFKLIGLSYYLDPETRWRDNRGHTWNLEKLLVEEMAQPINGAACGGTHRLMAMSYALIERQRKGQPIEGAWARAENYLNDYVNYTMTLQNSDGSFSTNWFESRGNDHDVKRRVQTTGHMLEWLIFTLPDEHLRSPRIQLSMEYLLRTVGKNPSYDWPIGPRGHALRAMTLYNQRVFGAKAGQMKSYIANEGGIPIRR